MQQVRISVSAGFRYQRCIGACAAENGKNTGIFERAEDLQSITAERLTGCPCGFASREKTGDPGLRAERTQGFSDGAENL